MNGKPLFEVEAKSVISFSEAFAHKLLTTGPMFSAGFACGYGCIYCYVPAMMHKVLSAPLEATGLTHGEVVIRRSKALELLENNLAKISASIRDSRQVCFCSSTVDPAPNMELAKETAECLTVIFEMTRWDVRLLSKSNLLPKVVALIPEEYHDRLILGVSTGTLDDQVARVVEVGTPLVSKRIESLHWLQDNGFRTYGMICPSLPQEDYGKFSKEICEAVRVGKCEHVWAEPMNVRGASLTNTVDALQNAGMDDQAALLQEVCGTGKKDAWDEYAKALFLAHKKNISAKKLRFLHYPTRSSQSWWSAHALHGAVLLGANA